ncbi:response regulator [Adhaeretor mobilis]|uniref:Response regulator rcp1 n=1 Tax=Adhaeretor mobilis TaxID=1930276 RepID=A0A517MT40_9BACT|nr:response regulator [Adhaeretor mobilis]QDS98051.1 Response regulator rcp1 [Adhaeretor mobilis]
MDATLSDTALPKQPIHILLVDDDEVDVMMTERVMSQVGVVCKLNIARDGIDALEFLRSQGAHEDACRPDLILLDLNMPRMSGHETLQAIKSDEQLATIPVVILTTSENENDVATAYKNHANGYLTKLSDTKKFAKSLSKVFSYWFATVRLPGN